MSEKGSGAGRAAPTHDEAAGNVDGRDERRGRGEGLRAARRTSRQGGSLPELSALRTWTPVDGSRPPPMRVIPPTAVMPETAFVTDMSGECSAGLTAHTHW